MILLFKKFSQVCIVFVITFSIVIINNLKQSSFSVGFNGKESICQCKKHKRCRFNPWVRKIPLSRKWQSTPLFLPEKSYGQWNLVGYSPQGCKELNMTERTRAHTHTHTHTILNGIWFNLEGFLFCSECLQLMILIM